MGFDSIHDHQIAILSRFMDTLNDKDLLPKTILYTLNPKDNVLGTMLGNFQDGTVAKYNLAPAGLTTSATVWSSR